MKAMNYPMDSSTSRLAVASILIIALFYFLMNCVAHSGLDDSEALFRYFWNDSPKAFSTGTFLDTFFWFFQPLPSAGASGGEYILFRPLRYVYQFAMVNLFNVSPFLAAAANACGAALTAGVVFGLARITLSAGPASLAALLLFACTPVIAMGQVYFVSQFVMVSFLVGLALASYRFVAYDDRRCLAATVPLMFLGSWYGEPIVMAIFGMFLLAAVEFLEHRPRSAVRAAIVGALLAIVFVVATILVRVPLSDFGITAIRNTIMAVLSHRGYEIQGEQEATALAIVSKLLAGIRYRMFGCLFFVSGPLLFVAGTVSALVLSVAERRFLGPIAFLGISLLFFNRWDVDAVIAGGLACLCLRYLWSERTGIVAAFCIASLVILGPVFSHDTHTAYVLPFLVILLVVSVVEAGSKLSSALAPRLRPAVQYCAAGILAALAALNLWTGAYFAYTYANFNRDLYEKWATRLSSAAVIGNFRHLPDLYVQGRYPEPGRRPDLAFSVDPSLGGPEFPITSIAQYEDWLVRHREAGIPVYAIVTDHHRLPGFERLFYDQFADRQNCRSLRRDVVAMKASAPFLDPGYLLAGYFHRRNLTPGFAGWTIFPDTLNDLGLEYSGFRKTLFGVYELREIVCADDEAKDAPMAPHRIRDNYRGFQIVAEAGGYSAFREGSSDRLQADSYHNIARRIDATFGDTVSAYSLSDSVGAVRDHGRFNIVIHQGIFYATLKDEAPFEKGLFDRGLYGCAVRGISPDAVAAELDSGAPGCEQGPELRLLETDAGGRCLLYGRQRYFIMGTCEDMTDIQKLQNIKRDAVGFTSRRLAESVFRRRATAEVRK